MSNVAPIIYDSKTIARFWAKVDKNGPVPAHMPHLGQCWAWTGALTPYGSFTAHKQVRAHRFSWELHCCSIPAGIHVLHHCDNPKCVNPSHLFLGTHTDNMQDMIAKGRFVSHQSARPHGEKHALAKLTDADVVRIREMNLNGESQARLGSLFNVNSSTIGHVVRRETWKHVL